jgi:hypothetical protein
MRARIPLAASMTLVSFPAFAAQINSVNVPIGALATQALSILEPLVLSLVGATVTWLMATLGPEIAKSLHAAHVDQAISRAFDAGYQGAEKGKVLEVPVANKVIRKAAQCLSTRRRGFSKSSAKTSGRSWLRNSLRPVPCRPAPAPATSGARSAPRR